MSSVQPPRQETSGTLLRVEVLTIFPELVRSYCSESLLGRACADGRIDLRVHDLRSGAGDPRRSVDDMPFGGGPGMVLAPEPVFNVVERVCPVRPLYLLAPSGVPLDQDLVEKLASGHDLYIGLPDQSSGGGVPGEQAPEHGIDRSDSVPGFSLLCGRYEGVDQRIADHLVDGEISIGDYILSGGELAALVVIEAVSRLLPGILGNAGSVVEESFGDHLLEYPQYTRPAVFRGWSVPEVLRSGDHGKVARWRRVQALSRTLLRRPDLIAKRGGLSSEEEELLGEAGADPRGIGARPGSRMREPRH